MERPGRCSAPGPIENGTRFRGRHGDGEEWARTRRSAGAPIGTRTRLMDVHGDGEEGARRVVQLRMRHAPVNTVVAAQGMRGVVKTEPRARSENAGQAKGLPL